MFKNYLIVALRILLKNKTFSFINIGGLTIGLTAAFLIILFVRSEMGYDNWLQDHDKIYTIESYFAAPGRTPLTLARSPVEVKAAMEKDYADIASFTRFYAGSAPVKIGNDLFAEKAFRIEETFFEVFDFPFMEGGTENALSVPYTAVVSREFKEKYFTDTSALGQIVSVGDQDYNITGVLEAPGGKTHMDFEILLFNGPGALNMDFIDWTSSRLYSYFILAGGANIENLSQDSADFLDRNAFFAPESWQDYKPSDVMDFSYRPIADIHLFQNARGPIGSNGSATLVYSFVGIAALIMIMASINFINLSTAGASTREKEIALHKVVGAKRSQLMTRYLIEAMALVGFAFIFALALTVLLAPAVFNWIGLMDIEGANVGAEFIIIAAASSFITGILAGLYPAFHLSSKSPASAFSGGRSHSPRVARFRIGLIFFQYTISIILVIAAAHFYLQTRLATTMDLGFDDENIVSYWGVGAAPDRASQQALLARVRQVPGVSSATLMVQLPGSGDQNNVSLIPLGADNSQGRTSAQAVAADVDFDKVMDMTLLAGRSFEQGRDIDRMRSDKSSAASIIINEIAMTLLGFESASDALGKTYQMQDYLNRPLTVEIIGVMKNAHFQSIHSEMLPMLFASADVYYNAMVVKLTRFDQSVIDEIDAIWPTYVPDVAVLKTYLTDSLAGQYALENRQTQVFGVFSALAIVIAFLGIFGLASFNVERRTKEVGIRKVFGASVMDIVRLFTWQFSKPVMWAILAAWPVAGLLIDNWLQSYAYRIDLMPLVFLSAGASVLIIAWATIASHAARAALKNPILALRYE